MYLYICNRKKCKECNEKCTHTSDPEYAVNPVIDKDRFIKLSQTGDYWEELNGSEGLRKYSNTVC